MLSMKSLNLWSIVLLMISAVKGQSLNQPKFCPSATWNLDATTFANNYTIGQTPQVIFITKDNTIYLTERDEGRIRIWFNGSQNVSQTITSGLYYPQGLFVTSSGDIYVDNGLQNGRVEKWTLNATSGVTVMNVIESCYGLFVDINLNPYVADCGNNRIQVFPSGQFNGTTLAGNGAPGTITLNCPTGIVFDADGYLFIVEYYGNRIVGSGSNGYRCIIGCAGSGSSASEFNMPYSFSFDTYGSIFVCDQSNERIQKFSLATNSCALSYNQPKLSPCAAWNPNAITFANESLVGTYPCGIFIDINNTVYVTNNINNSVQIWFEGDIGQFHILSGGLTSPYSIFVALNGDIYVDNGGTNGQVDKWFSNATNRTIAMYVNGSCFGLFVDIYDNIYCSLSNSHRVMKRSFNDNPNTTFIVAGTGNAGPAANMLNSPRGIFVNVRFSLYVADCYNNRIQLFESGQLNGTTIVGNGTMILSYPEAVVLDSDGYLFISDSGYNRIIGSGPNGFRCIVGCSGVPGNEPNQLNSPRSFGFDSYGNLFVADTSNSRVQKFFLSTNSCAVSYNQPKFSSCATWNADATTFANRSIIGTESYGIFIDINNTVYTTSFSFNRVQVWFEGSITPDKNISAGLNKTYSVFATMNGDIYIDNGQVDKWTWNSTNSTTVMYVNSICVSVFVDLNNYLYCSLGSSHQVVKKSLYDSTNSSTTAAGNGTAGSTSTMLHNPRGILVDTRLNLYVADCTNDRIQRFQSDSLNGTTVVGNGANGTITIDCPIGITMDADGYLFISDNHNHRVVGSDINGYRCIVGCTGANGSVSNQLSNPWSLSFDSYGNLFVVDQDNSRIQKFLLRTNSCDETTTSEDSSLATVDTIIRSTFAILTSTNALTASYQSGGRPSLTFTPSSCSFSAFIGSSCNISTDPCNMLKPCQNNATCLNHNLTLLGYNCSCSSGFTGVQCQLDQRTCQTDICWNTGTCYETSNTTFVCSCQTGWQDLYCQTKINYCANITCLNRGVCQPSFRSYTCLCLGGSYSGQHCEIIVNRLVVFQTVSRSFAYVVIIAMISAAMFIVILDVLKYVFGIDPVKKTLKKRKYKKKTKKKKKPVVVIRFIYVNAPPTQSCREAVSSEIETSV